MRILGLMSGTSVDGIDAALVTIVSSGKAAGASRLEWSLEHFTCVAWDPALRAAVLDACRADAPLQLVTALDYRVGEVFAEAAQQAVTEAKLTFGEVDCIASHGQTLWHQPTPFEVAGHWVTGTCQIGEPSVIAARTGCRVVADFRAADMAVGGQGAPLVPFADYALFRSPTETRVVQNIGGIANLTYLPRDARPEEVIAFDTGPGNMLLDALTQRLSEGGLTYDGGGRWAAHGRVDAALLATFLEDPYYAQPPPRSTGREQFGSAYAERFLSAAQRRGWGAIQN